jgi:ABC-2 type transport system ATP-binding protein
MEQIQVQNATKILKGRTVLDNVNLTLEKGGVYGFFGSNGSGKTMLFRAVCGLIRLTSGEINIFGKKIGREESFPENLGVIIETVGFWAEYTGLKNLKMLASIQHKIGEDEVRTAISRVGLDPNDKRTYRKYSLGMKQRLAVAQAVMEHPDLLVLDEPTNALDEDGVALIRNVILEENKRGATVLIASHNKEDLLKLCGKQFKMAEGRLKEAGGQEA